ncbi:MFS transporter, partial [Bacillus toyonensis]
MSENNWKTKIILFLTAQTISLFGSSLVQYAIIWYITLTTSSGV